MVGKSIEAKKLYDLYKYLVPKISTQEPEQETTSMELIQHKDKSNLNEKNNDGSEDLNTMAAFNELTTMPTEVELLLNEPELSHEPQFEDTGVYIVRRRYDNRTATSQASRVHFAVE
ncbi:hypothetical protein HF086_017049 [Spodoptera exigua]|uniref:Uncharacterized protein n=1 Tax=Spodoptera exigua TaxID=7107 RepID=A0A922M9F1_SPOEX|nr:hypothetical protein HF086_017049 [Spodoptera exigua]